MIYFYFKKSQIRDINICEMFHLDMVVDKKKTFCLYIPFCLFSLLKLSILDLPEKPRLFA